MTYRQLKEKLDKLSEEQLEEEIVFYNSSMDQWIFDKWIADTEKNTIFEG